MHLRNRTQRFGEHRLLLVSQRRQGFDGMPGIGQAVGAFQKLEQQPTALTFLQPCISTAS